MQAESNLDNWYAIFVYTGEEDNVKQRLSFRIGNELKLVVPKRRLLERKDGKLHEVIRVLFPGYILAQGIITKEIYPKTKNIPGLVKILGDNKLPYRIESYEMEVISHLIQDDEIIGYSRLLEENGRVKVLNGPMMDMEGNILSIDKRKGRAKILVNLCGKECRIDLGIELLKPVI
jgi:Transcription antiterminator